MDINNKNIYEHQNNKCETSTVYLNVHTRHD